MQRNKGKRVMGAAGGHAVGGSGTHRVLGCLELKADCRYHLVKGRVLMRGSALNPERGADCPSARSTFTPCWRCHN